MGLSIAISGGIMIFAIISTMMAVPNMLDATTSVSQASSEIYDVENSILKTDVNVGSVVATSGSSTILFNLTSSGSTKLWKYDKFNVIVTYDGIQTLIPLTRIRTTEQLAYAESCSISAGSWCVNAFINDQLDPKILNNGESIEIKGALQYPLWSSGLLIISVSTDNGIVASKSVVVI